MMAMAPWYERENLLHAAPSEGDIEGCKGQLIASR